jgi:hypothetical protein
MQLLVLFVVLCSLQSVVQSKVWLQSLSLLSSPSDSGSGSPDASASSPSALTPEPVQTSDATEAPADPASDPFAKEIDDLVQLGWSEVDVRRALEVCDNDIVKAADFLASEDEYNESLDASAEEMSNGPEGWVKSIALQVLTQVQGNVTVANAYMLREEKNITDNFEQAVAGMQSQGWDEIVARQVL